PARETKRSGPGIHLPGPPVISRSTPLRLSFERRVLDALARFGQVTVHVALHTILLGFRGAAGLLAGVADVMRNLVQATRMRVVRAMDSGGLLEHGLRLV